MGRYREFAAGADVAALVVAGADDDAADCVVVDEAGSVFVPDWQADSVRSVSAAAHTSVGCYLG